MGKGLPKNFNPIEFGSWMGGDRDGNPNVTAMVTKEVVLLSRWEAAKLYEKQLTKLLRSLSMSKCSKKILKKTGKVFDPYRVFLRPLRDKMRKTHILIKEHLVNKKPLEEKKLLSTKEEILAPLRIVRESLEQNQSENIASGDLLDLMRRAKCFGINLAKLDIRQESSRHSQLISEITKKKYTYNTPLDYQNIFDFQGLSLEQFKYINECVGFCVAWMFWYLEHKLLNPNIKGKKLVEKLKNKLLEDDKTILNSIRSYANKLDKYMVKKLLSYKVKKDEIYFLQNNNTLIQHVYKNILDDLLKIQNIE